MTLGCSSDSLSSCTSRSANSTHSGRIRFTATLRPSKRPLHTHTHTHPHTPPHTHTHTPTRTSPECAGCLSAAVVEGRFNWFKSAQSFHCFPRAQQDPLSEGTTKESH